MSLRLCQLLLLHDAGLVCSVLCTTQVRNVITLSGDLAARYALCCPRLGSHRLPVVGGRVGGGQHHARAHTVCTHSTHIATADDLRIVL